MGRCRGASAHGAIPLGGALAGAHISKRRSMQRLQAFDLCALAVPFAGLMAVTVWNAVAAAASPVVSGANLPIQTSELLPIRLQTE